jgi:hypothetical protein
MNPTGPRGSPNEPAAAATLFRAAGRIRVEALA